VKKLYAVDNGGEYSGHEIYFVAEDPGDWDDLESLLAVLGRVMFVTEVGAWRDESRCCSLAEVLNADRFVDWSPETVGLRPWVAKGVTRRDMLKLVEQWPSEDGHGFGGWTKAQPSTWVIVKWSDIKARVADLVERECK
jgi:hypothetical protein